VQKHKPQNAYHDAVLSALFGLASRQGQSQNFCFMQWFKDAISDKPKVDAKEVELRNLFAQTTVSHELIKMVTKSKNIKQPQHTEFDIIFIVHFTSIFLEIFSI
jgi:hypothetical protein